MSVTENYNLPLPDPEAASAKADVQKIREALIDLDNALANQNVDAYTKTETDAAINQAKDDLLGGAGAAHDTLQELAAELADDENAIASLANLVGLKANSSALKSLAYRDTVSASFIDPKSISNEHWVDNAENLYGVDWNDVNTNGFYMGDHTTNNPLGSDNRWWIGQVIAHNSLWVTQELWDFTVSSPKQYRRYKRNGTWDAWQPVVNNVWEHIQTVSVDASTSGIEFTNLSEFRLLKLRITARPETDGQRLNLRTSTNNGVSFDAHSTNYAWNYEGARAGGATFEGADQDSRIALGPGIGNETSTTLFSEILLGDFNQAQPMYLNGSAYYRHYNGNHYVVSIGGKRHTSVARDALKLHFTSGNIVHGHFVLEGVKG